MNLEPQKKQKIHRALLSWYKINKRFMPWRETSDPYQIWISEIMLQQTQVNTVTDYYHRFIKMFPTVASLARANLNDVMKAWENLGYYGRARNLHKAAQMILQDFNGKIPDEMEKIMSLPGIGRYTAGAILSIAFEKKVPVLDGNVIRILTRIFNIADNVALSGIQNQLWLLAEELLPNKNIRDYNEALMELGAMVCKPRHPLCNQCPVFRYCEAKRLGLQEKLPVRPPGKPVPHYHVVAGIIWKKDRFLITLREPRGLLGGLWEFPGGKVQEGESLKEGLIREVQEELHIHVTVNDCLVSVNHAYTHFKITLHMFHCRIRGGMIHLKSAVQFKWIRPEDLDQYAFPAANRKVLEVLREKKKGGF